MFQMANCHHIFTHNDLDGAVSVLVYMWSQPKGDSFYYTPISNLEIPKLKREVLNSHNPSKTLIFDMGLREEFLPDLDKSHIVFFDHHKSSENFIDRFKNAKIIYKEYSSNTLLMYKLLKDKIETTDARKLLVALTDDFDSYKLNLQYSYDLNILFWSEYQNRFSDFLNDYYDGFKPFTEKQKKAISFIKNEAEKEASKIQMFSGSVHVEGKEKRVCAAMVDRIVPQVMEVLVRKNKADLFFFINMKNEKVSIRQYNENDKIDCGAFAEKYCNGGGHMNAAAGTITPLFMEITKNLNPII
jgi:oligoribonuclease NrnB/cAMP/cGMP phosphodiesterase (DHH superfamily)